MILSLSQQTLIFFYACFFGVLLSCWCDLFRAVRILFGQQKAVTFVCDLLFFLTASVGVCLFFIRFCLGQVRFYVLVGEALGFLMCHLTVGSFVIRLFSSFVAAVRRFFSAFFSKLRPLFRFRGREEKNVKKFTGKT